MMTISVARSANGKSEVRTGSHKLRVEKIKHEPPINKETLAQMYGNEKRHSLITLSTSKVTSL